jgi:putative oxidoreductase
MRKINDLFSAAGGCFQSIALLLIRLSWGFQLYESGVGHLTHIGKTTQFFESLRVFGRYPLPFPALNVFVSGATELAGGILLMLGLFSRPIAVLLFFNFCVAYATAGWSEVSEIIHFHSPDDFINDAAFPFLAASLIVFAFGSGRVSLDALIFKKSASGG